MTPELAFLRIHPFSLDQAALSLLDKALTVSYYGHTRETIMPLLEDGTFQLWAGTEDGQVTFLVITQINSAIGMDKSTLDIWAVAGRGYTKTMSKIKETLLDFAYTNKLTHISATMKRKGLIKLFSFYPTETYSLCIMELPYVTH